MRKSGTAGRVALAGLLGLLAWLPTLGSMAGPVPPTLYVVEDAGLDIPQFAGITIPGINGSGRIVGTGPAIITGPRAPGVEGLPPFHAYRTNAALTVQQHLGTLGSGYSNAFGINDAGQVVGYSNDSEGATHAFRFTDGPGMEDLGALNGFFSIARKINSAGEIAGETDTLGGPVHAFRYVPGAMPAMQDLGTLPNGSASSGWSINEAGTVVGDSETDGPGETIVVHAFLREKGQPMVDLGTLPFSDYSAARDINNQTPPVVVGEGEPPPSIPPPGILGGTPPRRAMRYTAGVMISLGVLPGHSTSSAWAVNDGGFVVGRSGSTTSYTSNRAFIWSDVNDSNTSNPGEMVDLNTRLPMGSGWTLLEATDINNTGQITGIGLRAGLLRVFRLTPADANPPQLTNCSVTPPSRNALGGAFTLSVQATDNAGLQAVFAEVTRPDLTVVNVNLAQVGETNTYSGVFNAPANTGQLPDSYQVVFKATDTSNNTGSLACEPFVVNPNQAPVIVSCGVTPPTRPRVGGQFTVTAQVTDDIGVTSVTAQVSGPNPISDVILTLQAGNATNGTYSGTFDAPPNASLTGHQYQVQVVATDAPGASDSEPCGSVTVEPNLAPVILTCGVSPPNLPATGGQFVITAQVADDLGVSEVTAVISGPNAIPNVTLALQSGTATNGTYSGTFVAPPNPTPGQQQYQVSLVATDGDGATDTEDCGPATVNPNGAPVIVECSVSPPSRSSSGGAFTVTAQVTDDIGVSSVTAVVTGPNPIGVVNLALQAGTATNGTYVGVFNAPANGTSLAQQYQVQATAADDQGMTDSEDCGTATVEGIVDPVPPQIRDCRVTPLFLPRHGGLITISARATDNLGIAQVRARITRPDSSVVVVPLPNAGGDLFQGTYPVPANPEPSAVFYAPTVEVEDVGGNAVTAPCDSVRVAAVSETPSQGMEVHPKRLNFGKVKLRDRKRLSVTVQHAGSSAGSLLVFRLGTLRTPFRIVSTEGSVRGKGSGLFELGPGRKLKIIVEFLPTEVGCFEDDLLITGNDAARPSVAVHCIGKGCKAK